MTREKTDSNPENTDTIYLSSYRVWNIVIEGQALHASSIKNAPGISSPCITRRLSPWQEDIWLWSLPIEDPAVG